MRTATMTRPEIPVYDDDVSDDVVATAPESSAPAPPADDLPIGKHLFEDLSGTAGTGKTTTARRLIQSAPYGTVVLAATTGIAAVNLGEGTTINALLRYFNTANLRENYQRGILQAQIRKLRRAGVQRILIDEKSMMAGPQLTFITRAMREVNEGGIQALEAIGAGDDYERYDDGIREADLPPIGLTLVGDFGQLPPVPDKEEYRDKSGQPKWRSLPVEFAFDSPEWPLFAAHRTVLSKIWRQDAVDFIAALHAVRAGRVQQALDFFTAARFVSATDDHFAGTTIFAKNDEVERYNLMRLDGLRTPLLTFDTQRAGTQRTDWKAPQIPDRLVLKEGALVMILANRRQYDDAEDSEGRLIYANGDLGVLEGKASDAFGAWFVKLHRTGQRVKVYPVNRENTVPLEPGRKKELREQFGDDYQQHVTEDGKNEIIGNVLYMPLRAAYGTTVHKSQGLTLDNVQINIRDPFWKHPSMLFVALSRARTAEGLRLIGDQRGFIERIKVEPRVQPWL